MKSSQEKWRRLPSGLVVSPSFEQRLELMGVSDETANQLKPTHQLKTEDIRTIPKEFNEFDVLYIDDEMDSLNLFKACFWMFGLTCQGASTGEVGLKKLERHIPYLLIVDTMLPGIKGWEICEVVRANQKWENIPIIFVSMHPDFYIEKYRDYTEGCYWIPFEFKIIKILSLFVRKLKEK